MDTELRQRVQALLHEEKPSRSSGLRRKVERILRNEKKVRGRDKDPESGGQPPPAAHSAPPLEDGHGDREVLQMAGADFRSDDLGIDPP